MILSQAELRNRVLCLLAESPVPLSTQQVTRATAFEVPSATLRVGRALAELTEMRLLLRFPDPDPLWALTPAGLVAALRVPRCAAG